MSCNVGKWDRILRVLIAIVFFALAAFAGLSTTVKVVLLVLGFVLLFTAATGFCLLYKPFGINTCRR